MKKEKDIPLLLKPINALGGLLKKRYSEYQSGMESMKKQKDLSVLMNPVKRLGELYQEMCDEYNKSNQKDFPLFVKPAVYIGKVFKGIQSEYTAAQEFLAKERVTKQEPDKNEKIIQHLEKPKVNLSCETNSFHNNSMENQYYQPIYEKKLDNIERHKKRLDGDELKIYLLLCKGMSITIKDAARYLHCDYNHALYILNSLYEKRYIIKYKNNRKNYYRLL